MRLLTVAGLVAVLVLDSAGLSARRRAKCRLLCSADDLGGGSEEGVLVEAFGGIRGLRNVCELPNILPQGIIKAERTTVA